MRVSKWGNSLAVRLSKELVNNLGLKAGDEIDIVNTQGKLIEVAKSQRRTEAVRRMAELQWTMPPGYRFDRDEANRR